MTQLSLTTFWFAFTCYLIGMFAAFVYLASRRDGAYRFANAFAWVGFGAQLVSIVTRAIAAQRVPWGTMYEYSNLSALLIVGAELFFVEHRAKVRTVLGFALAYAVFTMAIASMFFYTGPEPLQPVLDSVWLKIHVFAIVVGSSMLVLGSGVITPLYLWKRWRERLAIEATTTPAAAAVPDVALVGVGAEGSVLTEDLGTPTDLTSDDVREVAPEAPHRRSGILPSAEALDRVAAQIITIGFFVFTFAVIAGAIWAQNAWGRYWGWDPKETWAFVTWVIFAGYLHARSTVEWKGKRAAIIALVGFVAMMVTYYGVNLLFGGLHSYAGLPT